MVPRIFKLALIQRDWHIFIQQSLGIFNVFITLTFPQIFLKMKTFKNQSIVFLVESTMMQNINFHTKLPSQKTILKQIEWKGQNGPIRRSGAATNDPNVHFCTFHKNLSCGCIFPASILNKVVFQQKNKFLLKSYFPSAIQIYKKYL